MIVIGKEIIGPWIAKHTHMIWTSENSECLGLERDKKLVAGVWYEDFNGRSVMAHIAFMGRLTKEFLFAIFDYPFNQMGASKVICPIISTNEASISLCKKLGFSEVTRLINMHPDGDMLFFELNRDDCKYLGEKYGEVIATSTSNA